MSNDTRNTLMEEPAKKNPLGLKAPESLGHVYNLSIFHIAALPCSSLFQLLLAEQRWVSLGQQTNEGQGFINLLPTCLQVADGSSLELHLDLGLSCTSFNYFLPFGLC